jgi:pyruvate kinase
LRKLIAAGLNVARLNFSHGTHEEHAARIATIRKVAAELDTTVSILQDLQGPKIRVGNLDQPLVLKEAERAILYAEEDAPPDGPGQKIPVAFVELFESVRTGDRLLLDDGRLALTVESAQPRTLTARVEVGGPLTSHKGINLPGVRLWPRARRGRGRDFFCPLCRRCAQGAGCHAEIRLHPKQHPLSAGDCQVGEA